MNRDNDLPNSSGDHRSPSELVVKGLQGTKASLPQKKNKKRYFPNFDYIRKLFVSTKLDQNSPAILLEHKPEKLVVEGYKEHKPPDKKKEIEVIFSGRKFIHGRRSQSVSSLGHNIDNIVIRHSATNVSAHMLHPTSHISQAMLSPSNIFGAIRTPNSSVSKDTFRVSSEETTRSVSPLPNSEGDIQSPSEFGQRAEGLQQLIPEQAKLAEDFGKGHTERVASSLLTLKVASSERKPEEFGEPEKWVPPDTHGLNNSDRIIPSYYLPSNMNRHNVLRVDYHYMILDDIRNIRPLNEYQLNYINNSLHESDKQKIIEEFNNVIVSYGEVLLNDQ